jgi:O-acetyl-ADP-ribose deacetylase (regulator of RNase III)
MHLAVVQGDITRLDVDAIVNAANPTLLGGGGVDGAIHAAAGPGLLEECLALPEVAPGVRCPTGEARITRGHNLRARTVIHTVGPVWDDHEPEEADRLLASCYTNARRLAAVAAHRSIAFPCISTGVYRFPPQRAADIAVASVRDFKGQLAVTYCCFNPRDAAMYRQLLGS